MSTKNTRSGGKYSGGHTTVIPAAAEVCDVASACETVTKISLGYIKAGLPSAHGQRRVKISIDGTSLLLSVRDNTTHQEIRVYATDAKKARRAIFQGARRAGLEVQFRENQH